MRPRSIRICSKSLIARREAHAAWSRHLRGTDSQTLFLHVIPAHIDIALPRGSRIPTLRETINLHDFARETFDLGRGEFECGDRPSGLPRLALEIKISTITTCRWSRRRIGDKLSIGIYSPARTLVDVIRWRHREGPDVAWEALRHWLARKGSKPVALLATAKHFHGAERSVRDALEVVL